MLSVQVAICERSTAACYIGAVESPRSHVHRCIGLVTAGHAQFVEARRRHTRQHRDVLACGVHPISSLQRCIACAALLAALAASACTGNATEQQTRETTSGPHGSSASHQVDASTSDTAANGGRRDIDTGDAGAQTPDAAIAPVDPDPSADPSQTQAGEFRDASAGVSHAKDAGSETEQPAPELLPAGTPLPDDWRIEAVAITRHQTCLLSRGTLFCLDEVPTGLLDRSAFVAHHYNKLARTQPAVVQQATGGELHMCALYDRAVSCWGDDLDRYSAIGYGHIDFLVDVAAVEAGSLNTCVLTELRSVWCWGDNVAGQLAGFGVPGEFFASDEPRSPDPTQIDVGGSAQDITAGGEHICARLDGGEVTCWGSNQYGEGGWGPPREAGTPRVNLGAGRSAVSLAAGWHHTCAALDDGRVKCWGYNNVGQLGLGDRVNRGQSPDDMGDALPAVDLGEGAFATQVAAGYTYNCALLSDGSIKCWGGNTDEYFAEEPVLSVGDEPGEMGDALRALDLGPGRTAKLVVAETDNACALLDDDSVKCWHDLPRE